MTRHLRFDGSEAGSTIEARPSLGSGGVGARGAELAALFVVHVSTCAAVAARRAVGRAQLASRAPCAAAQALCNVVSSDRAEGARWDSVGHDRAVVLPTR
eukprot:CAMPEP_0119470630 /NCGR_PEP_ID=MMETSP1344-20130328/3453_1 /TAXON_ID=236787 /ORGANISM="Florenciella parvula, Strain CCMP2471" /LENGTH=99 /DNA_ID=CAMNT_0007503331 /DNA_START=224 /DNA_END=524 /DNA_ORIENTATION=+